MYYFRNILLGIFISFLVGSTQMLSQICLYDSTHIIRTADSFYTVNTDIDTGSLQGKPNPNLGTDDRVVNWVHGLGGDLKSWVKAADAVSTGLQGVDFDEREVTSNNFSYDEIEEVAQLQNLATNVAGEIFDAGDKQQGINNNYELEDGIVFAHSQGGIVSRKMDFRYANNLETEHEKAYGGIVTFATSNQGAQIINNQGVMADHLQAFAEAMAAGPIEEYESHEKWYVRFLLRNIPVGDLVENIVSMASKEVGRYLVNESLPNVTDSYSVPDPNNPDPDNRINELNNYTSNSDLVAFYGTQKEVYYKDVGGFGRFGNRTIPDVPHPISWVALHYFINFATEYDHFKAHEAESKTPLRVHFSTLHYETEVDLEKRFINRMRDLPVYFRIDREGLNWASDLDAAQRRMDAWQEGVDYLNNFNHIYLTVIGARSETEVIEEGVTECWCDFTTGNSNEKYIFYSEDPEPGECEDLEDLNPSWECELRTETKETTVWKDKESDGVVLAESASEIPQATEDPQEMEGTTHMQLRNDDETAKALNTIFDGGAGKFFITDKRQ